MTRKSAQNSVVSPNVTTVLDVWLMMIGNVLSLSGAVDSIQLRIISALRTPFRKFALSAGNVLPLNRQNLTRVIQKAIARPLKP